MNRHLDTNLEIIDRPVHSPDRWKAEAVLESPSHLFLTLNARAVEFIAKPNKIQELRDCLREAVASFLDQQTGFSGALLLTAHKEPRLILVLSLWQTEKQASENRWEDASSVRRSVACFVDVCSRVHTYEAALPKLAHKVGGNSEIQVC